MLNRQSIAQHGLDWTRMSAAPGIAGSRRPEVEGIFVCRDEEEAEFFLQINNTGGPVEAPQFTVSGELIPAETVAGDTFDHSLDRHTLHVSITDAMGHDVRAALLATLFVGALRMARRSGADLTEQARQAHQALLDHGTHGSLVTGQLLRIDLRTGGVGLVNAGHPWPWLLREGHLHRITPEIDPPFGAPLPHPHRVQSRQLRPGDRLILVTDGMLERNAVAEDLPALIEGTRDLHPRDTVHVLTQAVLRAQQGVLHDDATVVCLDWRGTRDQLRSPCGSGQLTPHVRQGVDVGRRGVYRCKLLAANEMKPRLPPGGGTIRRA